MNPREGVLGISTMTVEITHQDGEFLVGLARKAVENYLKTGQILRLPPKTPVKLRKRSGVFVTVNNLKNGARVLRGCIGYPYQTTVLAKAVIECAISSATQDPRFSPVTLLELSDLVFELSILTIPQLLKASNPKLLPSKVEVGKDGLIVERGLYKGLLLPQVPVEYYWDSQEFLSKTCMKAGLTPDCWLMKDTKIMTFQCILVKELSPKGTIEVYSSGNLR